MLEYDVVSQFAKHATTGEVCVHGLVSSTNPVDSIQTIPRSMFTAAVSNYNLALALSRHDRIVMSLIDHMLHSEDYSVRM